MKQFLPESRGYLYPLIPYFYIWGAVWMMNAVLDYLWQWDPVGHIQLGLTAVSSVLSVVILIRQIRRQPPKETDVSNGMGGAWQALPPLLLIACIGLLVYVNAIDSHFLHLFLIVLLIFFYVQAGVTAGRPLVYLGLWLFALTAVLSLWYLGYTSLILGFFGGLSMIAAAMIVQLWRKQSP